MPRARKHLVCVRETPYYHITSRCVRRAFLCGTDHDTGKSFEHRRGWIEDRLRVLSSLFSIHVCAYAIMSNHYHLVIKLDPDESATWSGDEVLNRWTALFRGPWLVQRHRNGEPLSTVELDTLQSIVAVYRDRLSDLSWFMKCLNEPIARKANSEDRCTGHFWEARFHSQPLKSEPALIAAMAYVDLNPIRACLARTPEGSDYTSIQVRLRGDRHKAERQEITATMIKNRDINHLNIPMRSLLPFCGDQTDGNNTLPIREQDYLRLVDETGRVRRPGKRGRIDPELQSILNRLGVSSEQWTAVSTAFKQHYRAGDLRIKKVA